MKFGLNQDELELLYNLVVRPLQDFGCEVWIFGSRSKNNYHKFSDIDLLYKIPDGKTLPSGFISLIQESAEESRLSYKVDLVDERDLASAYLENVHREKILL